MRTTRCLLIHRARPTLSRCNKKRQLWHPNRRHEKKPKQAQALLSRPTPSSSQERVSNQTQLDSEKRKSSQPDSKNNDVSSWRKRRKSALRFKPESDSKNKKRLSKWTLNANKKQRLS